MRTILLSIIILLVLGSCNETLSIKGFDKAKWKSFNESCSDYRIKSTDLILTNKEVLFGANQNEINALLGAATEHELYDRNQKFFHYRLTPDSSCGNHKNLQYLSIRFNAIGRASDVSVVTRD